MNTLPPGTPDPSEYAPHYGRYVALVTGHDIVDSLAHQSVATEAYLKSLPPSMSEFRYAPGKWSVKEVIAHVIDSERVFAYRALSFARGDAAQLPGFEQDDWMKALSLGDVSLESLIDEYKDVRGSTVHLFGHLSPDAWKRRGTASDNPVTVRALAYIIAGHELHHLKVLREKYTNAR
jgi:hypothetical protein